MESQILPRKRVEQILSRAWVWETLAQHTDILAHDAALRAEIAWQSKRIAELGAGLQRVATAGNYEQAFLKKAEAERDKALAQLGDCSRRTAKLQGSLTHASKCLEDVEAELAAANDWLWRIAGPDSPAIRLQLGIGIEELERLGSPYCQQRLQAILTFLREQGASAAENLAHDGPQLLAKDDPATWEYCSSSEFPESWGQTAVEGTLESFDKLREILAAEFIYLKSARIDQIAQRIMAWRAE